MSYYKAANKYLLSPRLSVMWQQQLSVLRRQVSGYGTYPTHELLYATALWRQLFKPKYERLLRGGRLTLDQSEFRLLLPTAVAI